MNKKRGLLLTEKQIKRLYSLAETMESIREIEENDGEQSFVLTDLLEEVEKLLEELGLLRERI